MPAEVPELLRRHFRQHNLRAWLLALGSLIGACVVWGAIYLAMMWTGLLGLTVLEGIDAPVDVEFLPSFLILAVLLFVFYGFVLHVAGYRADCVQKFAWWKVVLDLLLLPVSLTLAVPANLRAQVFPSEQDLQFAWFLILRLRQEGKISVQQLPLEIPDRTKLEDIQYLLAISGLTDTDDYAGTWYVHLRNEQSRKFAQRLERLTDIQEIRDQK